MPAPADAQPKRWKKYTWVPKLLLTLAAFWLISANIDGAQLLQMLSTQNHSLILASAAFCLLQTMLGAVRWRFILHAISDSFLRLGRALRIFYISIFFNSCLPGTVGGDVVRIFLAKAEHVSTHAAINSVVVDRIVTFLALVILLFFSLPYVGSKLGISAAVVLPLLAIGAATGVAVLVNLHRMPLRWRETKIGGWLIHLADSVRQIMLRPKAFIVCTGLAVSSHVLYCLAAWVLARSLNIDLALSDALFYLPVVMLLSVLPISIGGWGLREAGMVGALGLSGVPAESALILSVQLALTILAVTLPGGLLWLIHRSSAGEIKESPQ